MIRVPTPVRTTVAAACLVMALGACSGSSGGGGSTPSASGGTSAPAGSSSSSGSTGSSGTKTSAAPPADTAKPSVAISTAPAVPVGKAAAFTGGSTGGDVKVTVKTVKTVKVKASGPGDIAGAGVSVAITVQNSSSKPFDLGGLAVNASYAKDKPAIPGGVENGKPLTGKLKAGKTAKGTYVFNVPTAQAKSLQVQVSSNVSPIILVFKR